MSSARPAPTATRPSGSSSSPPTMPRPASPPLAAAVRLPGPLPRGALRERQAGVDAAAIGEALIAICEHLEPIRGMKVQLTSIGTTAGQVAAALDRLRDGILAQIRAAEREIAAVR